MISHITDTGYGNERAAVDQIAKCLAAWTYTYRDEKSLHEGLADVLNRQEIRYTREFIAGPRDRFDFLCDGGVVIEAKIKGSLPAALRQVDRYCMRPDVQAVLIVTTRQWGRIAAIPPDAQLRGKPVRVVRIGGGAF